MVGGMIAKTGWLNIYRSGVYHRCGKPGAFDRHAGDLYPTEQAARDAIDPVSHYVDTVPVVWTEAGPDVQPNSEVV